METQLAEPSWALWEGLEEAARVLDLIHLKADKDHFSGLRTTGSPCLSQAALPPFA